MTLPVEYQEVEYIESSWATYQAWQYIDTWFTFTENAWQIKMKVMPTSFWSNYYDYRCGGSVQQWGTNRAFVLYLAYSTPYIWLWSNDLSTWKSVSVNNIYEWDIQANSGSVNYSVNWDTGSATYSWGLVNGKNYYIFCNFEGNTWHYYHANMKLYYFQIYQSWTLVRDFIPCYRKSDNVIWMYDLVNDVFYTNAWTWTFTKWPDILPPVPKFTLHWAIQTFHWKRPYEWKPWPNTVAYYPLNWDALDYSGNNRNLTTNNMIYTSWWPWQVAVFTSFWNYAYYQNNSLFDLRSPFTYNVRANASSITSWYYNGSHPYWNTLISIQDGTTIASHCEDLWFWLWDKVIWYQWNVDYMDGWTISTNHRYNVVFTYDGNGGKKLYIDWVQVASDTITPTSVSYSDARLVLSRSATSYNAQPYDWMLSNVIIEDKARTAQEIFNYYNSTKSNYWL